MLKEMANCRDERKCPNAEIAGSGGDGVKIVWEQRELAKCR